jgi:hypothetical protein
MVMAVQRPAHTSLRANGQALQFLDRLNSVIDLASNADPVQIGLPRAGVQLILEVCNVVAHVPPSMYTDTAQGRTSRT